MRTSRRAPGESALRGTQLPAITAGILTAGGRLVTIRMRPECNPAGWLAIAATALLLQACAEKPPSAPAVRVFSADVTGGAPTCEVGKLAPAAGQEIRGSGQGRQ